MWVDAGSVTVDDRSVTVTGGVITVVGFTVDGRWTFTDDVTVTVGGSW
jgi:hypothetical protein